MSVLHCLLWALAAFGGTLAVGAILLILKPLILIVLSPIGWYWEWVSRTFQSEFVELVMAVTPICGLAFAVLALIICWIGGKP